MSPLLPDYHSHTHHPKELNHISSLRVKSPVLCHVQPCSERWAIQAQAPCSTLRPSASPRVSIRESQPKRGPLWPRNSYSVS